MTDEHDQSVDRKASWSQPPRPEWLAAMNEEGKTFDLPALVPLDADSLVAAACRQTGLTDFGEDYWRGPLEALCQDLEGEAELNLMGRLMARSDAVIWLSNRLKMVDLLKQHPEILDEKIEAPTFIVGLPRSGTSILFEVLAQDPAFGVPLLWEAILPFPPPEAATYGSDTRIEQVDRLVTQWNRVVPEFATIHEMGGSIPAECGNLMTGSMISDQIACLQQGTAYATAYATADIGHAYRYHKQMLQVLQWRNPRKHWLLKAPAHQNFLPALLEVYPDARIIQTHRDPIKTMASATSLMGCLYYMRSDKAFDADAFANIMQGEATAARLELVMDQREQGLVPESNIYDSRYQDLMDDAMACVSGIYDHFGMSLTDEARQRMLDYLAGKPKGKFGAHKYSVNDDELAERRYFARYQQAYNVPNET